MGRRWGLPVRVRPRLQPVFILGEIDLKDFGLTQLIALIVGLDATDARDCERVDRILCNHDDPANSDAEPDDEPYTAAVLRAYDVLESLSACGRLGNSIAMIRAEKRANGATMTQIRAEQNEWTADRDRKMTVLFESAVREGKEWGAKTRLAKRYGITPRHVTNCLRRHKRAIKRVSDEDLSRLKRQIESEI